MSVKDPCIRIGLKVVVLGMLIMVVHSSVQDYHEHQGGVRRLAALQEIKSFSVDKPQELKLAKR